MYTQLDDQRKANFIKQYLETHPNCTRKELVQETVTTCLLYTSPSPRD